MSHNYLNKNRTQELINTIRGHLSDIATVLSNLASGDARDNTKAPINHNQPSSTITSMTGYSKPQSTSAIAATDTLNEAIGKLEKGLDGAGTPNDGVLTIQQNGTTIGTFSANQAENTTINIEAVPAPYIISNAVNSDDGTSVVENTIDVGITDTVNYSNLFAGETYTLKTKVYDTVTQTYLSITKNGTSSTEITSTITPSTNSGSYINNFSIDDLIDAADNTVLNVIEKLYYNNGFVSIYTSNVTVDAALTSWDNLQRKVRLNKMNDISIGDQFVCSYGNSLLTWDAIGKNQDTPSNNNYSNTLTLRTHSCLPNKIQFDVDEAFYYCSNRLEAGTYHFKYYYTSGYNSYIGSFTLTQPVPEGGQLTTYSDGTYSYVRSYASKASIMPIESVRFYNKSSSYGSSLGNMNYDTIGENFNSYVRWKNGYNNYKESAVRQWLNSNEPKSEWWKPQNKWDRPPEAAAVLNGFLYELDPDFLSVIGLSNKTTDDDTTSDMFFLLSLSEIYALNSGQAYTFYSDGSVLTTPSTDADTNRIVYENNATIKYTLRNRDNSSTDTTRTYVVKNDGSVSAYSVVRIHDENNLVVACNII